MKKPKKKKPKPRTFPEEYLVSYDRKKPDGYWERIEESVFVDVVAGINEKDNHAQAEQIVKTNNPGCIIRRVLYC